jgi:hypothetical protein
VFVVDAEFGSTPAGPEAPVADPNPDDLVLGEGGVFSASFGVSLSEGLSEITKGLRTVAFGAGAASSSAPAALGEGFVTAARVTFGLSVQETKPVAEHFLFS